MTTLQILTISVYLGLLSCNNNRTEISIKTENAKVEIETIDTDLKPEQNTTIVSSDTIKRFEVDDYQVIMYFRNGKLIG